VVALLYCFLNGEVSVLLTADIDTISTLDYYEQRALEGVLAVLATC